MKYTFFLLILLAALQLQAQDSLELAPVTVTAPAWATSAADARPVVTLTSADLLVKYYGQEPALLLERQPSVTAFTDAGSAFGYAYFRLRGIDQTRLNFTLDGVPLNEPEDQGFYFNNYVDLLSSVRAVQLQPGVNVDINGTAAYAGSVQLRSPALTGEPFTEVSAGYGSYGSYRASAAARRQLGTEGWNLYARATHLGSSGYKDHSDHRGTSAFVQLGRAEKKHLLKFTAFGGNQQNQMAWLGVTDSLLQENPRANANGENERDNFTTTLTKVQYAYLASDAFQVSTSLYHGYQQGNYDFDLNNFLGADIGAGLLNYAFRYHNLGLLSNLAYQKNEWELRAGLHFQDYRRRHLGSEGGVGQLYVNTGKKREASGFASLARQTGSLHLRAAAQLRHSSFGYEGSVALEPLNFTFLNYNLAATLSLGNSRLYYRFGSVGREPTRNDIFGGEDNLLAGTDGPATIVTEPETVFDHELGLRGQTTSLDYQVNAFYLRFRNEIVLSGAFGPNGLPLRSSVAESYRAGLEWQLAYRLNPAWELHQTGAWSDNKITQEGTTFNPVLSPEVLLNQGLTYRRKAWTCGLDLRYQGAGFIDLANEHQIAGFATLDARVGWEKGRWIISGFVFNLTDESYATNGQLDIYGRPTFHRRAGINGWVSVTYRW